MKCIANDCYSLVATELFRIWLYIFKQRLAFNLIWMSSPMCGPFSEQYYHVFCNTASGSLSCKPSSQTSGLHFVFSFSFFLFFSFLFRIIMMLHHPVTPPHPVHIVHAHESHRHTWRHTHDTECGWDGGEAHLGLGRKNPRLTEKKKSRQVWMWGSHHR